MKKHNIQDIKDGIKESPQAGILEILGKHNIGVTFNESLPSNTAGVFRQTRVKDKYGRTVEVKDQKIELNTNQSKEQVEATLVHEGQHAIDLNGGYAVLAKDKKAHDKGAALGANHVKVADGEEFSSDEELEIARPELERRAEVPQNRYLLWRVRQRNRGRGAA